MEKFKQFLSVGSRLRTLTAIIMFLIVFIAYKIGFWGVNGLILLITAGMIYEYDKMFNKKLGLSFFVDEILIIASLFYYLTNISNPYLYYIVIFLFNYFCLKLIINAILNKKHWFLESIQPVYIGVSIFSILCLYNANSPALIYAFIILLIL